MIWMSTGQGPLTQCNSHGWILSLVPGNIYRKRLDDFSTCFLFVCTTVEDGEGLRLFGRSSLPLSLPLSVGKWHAAVKTG